MATVSELRITTCRVVDCTSQSTHNKYSKTSKTRIIIIDRGGNYGQEALF